MHAPFSQQDAGDVAAARARLASISGALLAGEEGAQNVPKALYDFFAQLVPEAVERGPAVILSPGGMAIEPADAAACLLDGRRTFAFVNGLLDSIKKAGLSKQGPVRLLYAGCGPFASLVTPLLPFFSPDALQLYLLDLQESSLAAAKKLYAALGFQEFVAQWIEADAVLYEGDGTRFDLVVSETMDAALFTEPQWSITRQLAPLLAVGGRFVPERIQVDLALSGGPVISPLICLRADEQLSRTEICADAIGSYIQLGEHVMPHVSGQTLIELRTEIETASGYLLKNGDCRLSLGVNFFYLKPEDSGRSARFTYRLGTRPAIVYELL